MLKTSDFDTRYFEGHRFEDGGHPAGYSNYLSYAERIDAESVVQYYGLVGKSIFEVGCGCGHFLRSVVQHGCLPSSGGIDISPWCIENSVVPEMTIQGDVFALAASGTDRFDVGFTMGFLNVLTDAECQRLVDILDRFCDRQVHLVDMKANPEYYQVKTLEEWKFVIRLPETADIGVK